VEEMLALVPTPIGVGPQYRPRPAMHGPCVFSGRAIGRVHVELFAHRRVVIVPPRIGIRSARCRGRVWTLAPTGVVELGGPARLGDLFAVWGKALTPRRLLGFRGRVHVFVDGVRRRVDPRSLVLRNGAEIVLEVGGYVPPHRFYVFPPAH
jgi:hypothetical protein